MFSKVVKVHYHQIFLKSYPLYQDEIYNTLAQFHGVVANHKTLRETCLAKI